MHEYQSDMIVVHSVVLGRGARLTDKTQSKGRLELFLEKTDKKTVMGLLLIIVNRNRNRNRNLG